MFIFLKNYSFYRIFKKLKYIRFSNFYLLINSIYRRRKLYISFLENANYESSRKIFSPIFKTSIKTKIGNKLYDKNFSIKTIREVNLKYKSFHIKNVFIVPSTDILYTFDKFILSNKEKFKKGQNYFQLNSYSSFIEILTKRNKHYLKFIGKNQCILSRSFFSENEKFFKGINLISSINNYWHFIIEQAPKIIISSYLNIPNDIPILVPDNLHPNLIEIINIINQKKGKRKIVKVKGNLENLNISR